MADTDYALISGLSPASTFRDSKPTPVPILQTPVPDPPAQPSYTAFSPAQGTSVAPNAPLSFDIAGVADSRIGVALVASFAGSLVTELVFNGTSFLPLYAGLSSFHVSGDTAHVVLRRTPGWPGAPTITAFTLYTV